MKAQKTLRCGVCWTSQRKPSHLVTVKVLPTLFRMANNQYLSIGFIQNLVVIYGRISRSHLGFVTSPDLFFSTTFAVVVNHYIILISIACHKFLEYAVSSQHGDLETMAFLFITDDLRSTILRDPILVSLFAVVDQYDGSLIFDCIVIDYILVVIISLCSIVCVTIYYYKL